MPEDNEFGVEKIDVDERTKKHGKSIENIKIITSDINTHKHAEVEFLRVAA